MIADPCSPAVGSQVLTDVSSDWTELPSEAPFRPAGRTLTSFQTVGHYPVGRAVPAVPAASGIVVIAGTGFVVSAETVVHTGLVAAVAGLFAGGTDPIAVAVPVVLPIVRMTAVAMAGPAGLVAVAVGRPVSVGAVCDPVEVVVPVEERTAR